MLYTVNEKKKNTVKSWLYREVEILRHTVLVGIFDHISVSCNILSGIFRRWDQFWQLQRWCILQTQACISISAIISLVPSFNFFYSEDCKASMTDCILQRWLQDLLSHICSSRTLLLAHQQGHTISPSLESVWFRDLLRAAEYCGRNFIWLPKLDHKVGLSFCLFAETLTPYSESWATLLEVKLPSDSRATRKWNPTQQPQ